MIRLAREVVLTARKYAHSLPPSDQWWAFLKVYSFSRDESDKEHAQKFGKFPIRLRRHIIDDKQRIVLNQVGRMVEAGQFKTAFDFASQLGNAHLSLRAFAIIVRAVTAANSQAV